MLLEVPVAVGEGTTVQYHEQGHVAVSMTRGWQDDPLVVRGRNGNGSFSD